MAGQEKTAGVKLTLNKSAFRSGLSDAERDVQGAGKRMGKALGSGLKDGMKGADEAVKGLLSGIKNGLSQLAGIGGALGTADLMRHALKTESVFRGVAFQIRAGSGAVVNFRDMMGAAQGSAQRWGQDIDHLGDTMKKVWEETGNAKFTQDSIEVIATTARGAHQPLELLGHLSGVLNEKFGVTSEQLGDTLASVISLGNKGGVTVEELSQRFGIIGAVAKDAGLQGQQGFAKMIGLLNMADDSGKNLRKNVGAMAGIFEHFGTKVERNKTAMKLGIDPSQMKGDVTQMIGQVLKATKGNQDKLSVAFQGDQLTFLTDLGSKYAKAFDETKGSVKEKTAAGLKAYEDALAAAGRSQLKYSDIQDNAANEMKTGQAKLDAALEKMKAAFTREEVTDAIGKLADALPKLADVVSSVVGFAAEHPVLAGGAVLGGTAAKGFGEAAISGFITAAFSRGGATAAGSIAKGLATGGAEAATSLAASAGPKLAVSFGGYLAAAGVAAAIGYTIAKYVHETIKEHDAKELNEAINEMDKPAAGAGGDGASGASGSSTGRYVVRDEKTGAPKIVYGDEAARAREENEAANQRFDAEWREDKENRDKSAFISIDKASPEELADMQKWREAKAAREKGGGMSAENARLLADMLRASPLEVRISNPEAIRAPGAGGGGGGPMPGYLDR